VQKVGFVKYKSDQGNSLYFAKTNCVCKNLQKSAFNPLSNNLEILIIQQLSMVVSILGVLLATSKQLHQWSRQIWGLCPKMPLRMYINHCGTSWLLFSYLINFCSCVESRKQNRTQVTLNQHMKEIIQVEYFSINCTAHV